MDIHEDELSRIADDLQRNLTAPVPDTPAFLDRCLSRLKAVPHSVSPPKRIAVLFDVAAQYYFHGQKVFSGVEPIALAVMLSDQAGDKSQLRKALNLQGLILSATNNLTDAVNSLLRALDLAEQLGEQYFVVAAWINIATAFSDATLFTDARVSFERALAMACELPDSAEARYAAAKALHGSAFCSLRLHEYLRGLDSVEEAIALLQEPTNRDQEQARVLTESTYVRLLLATNRIEEAVARSEYARAMAERAKSARASLSAASTRGLVEVYSGHQDVGLSRIAGAVEQARKHSDLLYETLQASVLGFERAGKPDRAVSAHREVMMRMRRANQEAIELHQALHLQRLQLPAPDAAGLEALEATDEKLKANLMELAAKQYEFLEQIAMRVELREEPAGEHAFRVAMWAKMLAIETDMSEAEATRLEQAARLHDIGKIVIPDSVILKKTALSAGERHIIETHAANGADMLSRARLPYATLAEEIARHHHEHWDGGGYPEQLAGNAIPLPARIVGLCDAFDAMVHDRVYRRAHTVEEALGQIARERERQFDPHLVDRFIPLVRRIYREYKNVNAFLTSVAQTTTLSAIRRSVEERATRSELDSAEANEQPRQQPQSRFRRTPDKPT
jgi:putative two-component system response regulator